MARVGRLRRPAEPLPPFDPPQPSRCEAIAAFLGASADWRAKRRLRLVPTGANTQPAFGCYLDDPDGPTAHCTGVLVLTVSNDRISAITRFLDGNLPRLFGLADALV